MNHNSLSEKVQIVFSQLSQIIDSPQKRLQSRSNFYQRLPHLDKFYGDSEISFMRWEIQRGVLNSLKSPQPGSRWWQSVNNEIFFQSELAWHYFKMDLDPEPLPLSASFWYQFISDSSSQKWYQAHNTSILTGYLKNVHLLTFENNLEINFINKVLYRVLYAQALVEGKVFGKIGEIIADPRLFAVSLLTTLCQDCYPLNYPLLESDRKHIEGEGHHLGDFEVQFLDHKLILPHLFELYSYSAQSNQFPKLITSTFLCLQKTPCYGSFYIKKKGSNQF